MTSQSFIEARPSQNARGWDMSFATNHVGSLVLTEALHFGEKGDPMQGSTEVRDIAFQNRVLAETRALLREP